MQLVIWKCLVALRFLFTCIPQTGYLHPDEYFQSIEILSGDILDLDTHRTWEFNITCDATKKPIRSIVLPFLTVGIPILLLKKISQVTEYLFGICLLTPHGLLVLPRLLMTALSLITDLCLGQICRLYGKNCGKNRIECLCVYASSYVVLIYFTRTLTNATEAVLYACLLWVVAKCMHNTDKILLQRNKLNPTDVDLGISSCHRVALLLTVGIFNRPTFAAFTAVPLTIWISYGYGVQLKSCKKYVSRVTSLVPGVLATSVFFILCDTAYFKCEPISVYLTWESLLQMTWTVTPMNFFAYNSKQSNLMEHGLHPHYIHLLVNMPLLFNVLGIAGVVGHVQLSYKYLKQRCSVIHAIENVMVCSYIVPVLILSLVPHQEPRFIIPVLLPLVFVHGNKLTATPNKTTRFLQMLWVLGNMVCCAFFGFLHQGGVIPNLVHLQTLKSTVTSAGADAIFYHTYMPPRFLLFNQKHSASDSHIRVHDLMGGSLLELHERIDSVQCSPLTILISPTSLRNVVTLALDTSYAMYLNSTFAWHLSMEDPPSISAAFFSSLGLDTFILKSISENSTCLKRIS